MQLKPSEILYSQDSINIYFDSRSSNANHKLGETLDDICEGKCSIESIPAITVVNQDVKWMTTDNRRLWVFKELELLGKCVNIQVNVGQSIPESKRTTKNNGVSIIIRGYPGGDWYQKHENRDHFQIVPNSTRYDDNDSDDNFTHSDNSDNYDSDSDGW
ncbi:uncharacterized protein LOC127864357 isoform X1 [Dreissena polymorpha]|uniref:Uncharacterized protein n=1 Tax=Dreissena polymorpha TaxID=45954 RepID=A0A9D4NK03_DREPO|nr:uncharacterized protein LOC127864357 isoform X1 [Dreissena polymorpha]KAH3896136.1 hypothetical protein DPMN_020309 [Dreissena polymorpha]